MPLPTETAKTQADPKTAAANIAKGIEDKASGKTPDVKKPDAKGPADAATDPNAGKRKYVVNSKEIWLTPQQADAYVQKGILFEPRISELARLQNETAAFLEVLKTDPAKVLFNPRIGLTPETAFEKIMGSAKISDAIKESVGRWYYENVVKLAKMDEKDRAIFERDQKIKDLEASDQQKRDQAIAEENRARVQSALGVISAQIAEAMKETGLPDIDTPLGVQLSKRIADVMRLSYLARKACTPKQAAQIAMDQMKQAQAFLYDNLDEEKLVETLGKENAEKVRKYFLKTMKQTEKSEKEASGSAPPTKRGDRKTMTPDEFHDYLDTIKSANKI